MDAALLFDLRSATLAVVDALQWIIHSTVGGFITLGAPDSTECEENSSTVLCARPVEPKKDEGPATTISFVGIEMDLVGFLPRYKLKRLKEELSTWRGRKTC